MLTPEHLLILNVLKAGPVGRVFLSESLGIGEGKIRKLLNELKKQGLIISSKAGHYLSRIGESILEEIGQRYFKVTRRLSIRSLNWPYAVEGIVRGRALRSPLSKNGMYERDLLVRNGALGAIVSVYNIRSLNWPYAVEGIVRGRALRSPISKNGMYERDLFVRNGALGAIVSVYKKGEARLPDTGIPLTEAIPGYVYESTVLRDLLEEDLLIIVSGENFYRAMYAFIKGSLILIGDVIL